MQSGEARGLELGTAVIDDTLIEMKCLFVPTIQKKMGIKLSNTNRHTINGG